MPKRPTIPEDLYRFRWVSHIRLSADGSRVAYCVTWADPDSRENRSRVYVQPVAGSSPPEPIPDDSQDQEPEWSPDGRLAFTRKVAGVQQLFCQEPGGAARQLTSLVDGVGTAAFSPDGRFLAFLGTVVSDPEGVVDDPRPSRDSDPARRPPVARVARGLNYKRDGLGYADGRSRHLFVVPTTGGHASQLTQGPWAVEAFSWAPNSTHLAVVGDAEPDADLRMENDIYLVDLKGDRTRIAGGLLISSLACSPAGDVIAFGAPLGPEGGLLQRVWTVPVTGGEPSCLTSRFDLSAGDGLVSDMRADHHYELHWDGGRIHFLATGRGETGIWSVGEAGDVRQEVGGRRDVFGFDVSGGVTAFCASDAFNPGDALVLEAGQERRLSDLNPWLAERWLGEPEPLSFKASDGVLVEGWLLTPPGFDSGRRHPLVLEVHGGPHAAYGWNFFHEFQMLAGMGFLVLYLNPRGSDGYGEEFRTAVTRDWGGKDFGDLMTGLDEVIGRGFVDEGRLGIAGGSYGGYMTNWAIGHTDRFAAAVAMRSIANLVSEFTQHDIALWGATEMGPPPWTDPDELWRRSPIRYVADIHTPLLLLHSEMDLRCAISQAEEIFGALRLLGREVEMVRYPGESHDLSRSGRPDRRVDRLRRIAAWFERHLSETGVPRAGRQRT